MSQAPLKCDQLAAKEIYEQLTALDQSGVFPQGLNLDSGYRKLNYRDISKPKVTVEGKEGGGVSCEETWENGLQALDPFVKTFQIFSQPLLENLKIK